MNIIDAELVISGYHYSISRTSIYIYVQSSLSMSLESYWPPALSLVTQRGYIYTYESNQRWVEITTICIRDDLMSARQVYSSFSIYLSAEPAYIAHRCLHGTKRKLSIGIYIYIPIKWKRGREKAEAAAAARWSIERAQRPLPWQPTSAAWIAGQSSHTRCHHPPFSHPDIYIYVYLLLSPAFSEYHVLLQKACFEEELIIRIY